MQQVNSSVTYASPFTGWKHWHPASLESTIPKRYVINDDKPFYPNVMTDIPPQAEIAMLIGFHTEAKSKIYVQGNVLSPGIYIYILLVGPLPFYLEVLRILRIMDQVSR